MNSTTGNRIEEQTGSALLAVMGIVFLIAIVAASMVANGRQQIFAATHLREYVKAQQIAEAGANHAYNVLKTNFAARLDPNNFPLTQLDTGTNDCGSYHAYVVPGTGINSNRASITSTGFYGNAKALAKVNVENFPTSTTNGAPVQGSSNPYGFAILTGGDLGWAGNSDLQTSNGWMHCNGAYSANGVNTVHGNVESVGGIGMVGQATITGTGKAPTISGGTIGTPVVGSVPVLSIPNIDLTPYYNAALANGEVYASGKSFTGHTPKGGIAWVNGTMSLGTGTYNGSFIATGAIELKTAANNTSITMNKVNSYPVLASRDSTITIKQAKTFTFNGLIYCKTGSFDKQGNGDVIGTGAIIAAGNVTKNGGWSGLLWSDPTPIPPGGSAINTRDKVIITAWQQ